jgi:2-polyprenyl-3-methyl-5-hydroxy-6-metoxy-1,4-benzoquinol methylase
MPVAGDIGKAYGSYYTHTAVDPQVHNRRFQLWLRLARIYRPLLKLTGICRQRQRAEHRYLNGLEPGRLLDVGCGHGHWLAQMREKGWQVEGQDIDAAAAQLGRRTHGLNVHIGTLSHLELPSNSFDAITLSHVIEHVHEPDSLLAECRRLLKPGGTVVAVTPNLRSYGHQRFGVHWIGLDPPRHLMLFSPTSLARVAFRAGFVQYRIWSTPVHAQFTAIASYDLRNKGRHRLEDPYVLAQLIRAVLFEWSAWLAYTLRQDAGDECVLQAVK